MRKRREKRRDDQLEANKGLAPRPDPQIINGNPSLHIREKAPHGTRSMLPRIIASTRVAWTQRMPEGYNPRTLSGREAVVAIVAARRPRIIIWFYISISIINRDKKDKWANSEWDISVQKRYIHVI